jgi:hypothetical protein
MEMILENPWDKSAALDLSVRKCVQEELESRHVLCLLRTETSKEGAQKTLKLFLHVLNGIKKKFFVTSGFRRGINETSALLRC